MLQWTAAKALEPCGPWTVSTYPAGVTEWQIVFDAVRDSPLSSKDFGFSKTAPTPSCSFHHLGSAIPRAKALARQE